MNDFINEIQVNLIEKKQKNDNDNLKKNALENYKEILKVLEPNHDNDNIEDNQFNLNPLLIEKSFQAKKTKSKKKKKNEEIKKY